MSIINYQLSIIIVTWNNIDTITACLNSIKASEDGLVKQVIVVDNDSEDKTCQLMAVDYSQYELIRNEENRGFAAAVNQGLEKAVAPLIMFLNPDAVLTSDAIGKMIDKLNSDKSIAVIGPQLLNRDNTIQPSGRKLPSLDAVFVEAFFPSALKKSEWYKEQIFDRHDFSKAARVEEVSGACFITKKSIIKEQGLFDESFFLYFEETDWFKRLATSKQVVLYYPLAKVIHLWGHSMNQDKTVNDTYFYHSQINYWKKYYGWWSNLILLKIMFFQGLFGWMKSIITFKSKMTKKKYKHLMALSISHLFAGKK